MKVIDGFKNFVSGGLRQVMYLKIMREASAWAFKREEDEGWEKFTGKTNSVQGRSRASVEINLKQNFQRFLNDGFVKQGVRLHTDFTFGNGIQIPKAKSDDIQERVIEPTWNDPTNQRNMFNFYAQQKRSKEYQIGGEVNLLVKTNPANGRVKFQTIKPGDIEDVIADQEDQERPAFYSIRHSLEKKNLVTGEVENSGKFKLKVHRALRYKLDEATPEQLEQGLVYHVGQNEIFHILRGYPDMSAIRHVADVANDMTEDGATLSKANAEVAFKTKLEKGGKKSLDDMMSFLRTRTDGTNPAPAVASDYVHNQHVSRNWMQERNTGANYREKDLRAVKLYMYAGYGYGEHYFGDPATGNLATATSMELPVLKMTEAEQKLWESIYKDLFDFAIDYAIAVGNIQGSVIDWDEFEVQTDEDRRLDIDFPPILRRDIEPYTRAVLDSEAQSLITSEEATRLIAQALGSNNVDEIIEELYDRPEIANDDLPVIPEQLEVPEQPVEPEIEKEATESLLEINGKIGDLLKKAVEIRNGNGNGKGKYSTIKLVK